jgi:hypothetical protein
MTTNEPTPRLRLTGRERIAEALYAHNNPNAMPLNIKHGAPLYYGDADAVINVIEDRLLNVKTVNVAYKAATESEHEIYKDDVVAALTAAMKELRK